MPISIKDAINTKDILTTAGSKILNNFLPPKNAFVVDKLLDEGAIITSKSNCDEFAMGSSNETSQFGPCLNPWDLSKVPGEVLDEVSCICCLIPKSFEYWFGYWWKH